MVYLLFSGKAMVGWSVVPDEPMDEPRALALLADVRAHDLLEDDFPRGYVADLAYDDEVAGQRRRG